MRIGTTRISTALLLLALSCAALSAESATAKADSADADGKSAAPQDDDGAEPQAKVIAGWLEMITLPATGWVVKAKLDSGAKTSSIHATNIEEFERDGDRWVRFELHDSTKKENPEVLERRRVRRVRIKDHDDPSSRRLVVELEICLDGRLYKPQFSLADRGNFHYPVLLGRRFLSGVAVIDPAEKYLTSPACPDGEPAK